MIDLQQLVSSMDAISNEITSFIDRKILKLDQLSENYLNVEFYIKLTSTKYPRYFKIHKIKSSHRFDGNEDCNFSCQFYLYGYKIARNMNISTSEDSLVLSVDTIGYYEVIPYEQIQEQLGHKRKDFAYHDKYLYFFINETGRIKIGQAIDVEERRKAIESASGQKVRILKTIPNAAKYESLLHKKFSKHKMIGEWFDQDQSLIDYIMNLTEENLKETFK